MLLLQKPIRGDFFADNFSFGFGIDRAADRGELNAEPDVVDKASHFVGRFLSGDAATHNIFQFRRCSPKRRWSGFAGRFLRATDEIHWIVSRDLFIAETGNVIFRREITRVNHHAVSLADSFFAQLAVLYTRGVD